MKVRGYLKVYDDTTYSFSALPEFRNDKNGKIYTFEMDVPHNFTELKTVSNLEVI